MANRPNPPGRARSALRPAAALVPPPVPGIPPERPRPSPAVDRRARLGVAAGSGSEGGSNQSFTILVTLRPAVLFGDRTTRLCP